MTGVHASVSLCSMAMQGLPEEPVLALLHLRCVDDLPLHFVRSPRAFVSTLGP